MISPSTGSDGFIVGGGEIYRLALPLIDVLYTTEVHATLEGGDAWFPEYRDRFNQTYQQDHPADERHAYAFSFRTFHKK